MVYRVLVSLQKNEFTPAVFQNSQVFLFGQRTVIEILAAHVAGYLAVYAACGKQDYAAFCEGAAQFLGQAALRGMRRVKNAVPCDDGVVDSTTCSSHQEAILSYKWPVSIGFIISGPT